MSNVSIKATIMWAQLEERNEMSGKFQVDLCQLSDRAVEALESKGIEVKEHEGKGSYITCKSKNPIYAKDTDGVDLRGIRIGNGSECVAAVGSYEWTFKNRSGVSPSLNGLVITALEIYDGEGGDSTPDLDEAL